MTRRIADGLCYYVWDSPIGLVAVVHHVGVPRFLPGQSAGAGIAGLKALAEAWHEDLMRRPAAERQAKLLAPGWQATP